MIEWILVKSNVLRDVCHLMHPSTNAATIKVYVALLCSQNADAPIYHVEWKVRL